MYLGTYHLSSVSQPFNNIMSYSTLLLTVSVKHNLHRVSLNYLGMIITKANGNLPSSHP